MIRDNRSTKRSVIIPKGEGVVWVSHIREAREMLKVKIPLRLRNPERRMGRVYQIANSVNSKPKSRYDYRLLLISKFSYLSFDDGLSSELAITAKFSRKNKN